MSLHPAQIPHLHLLSERDGDSGSSSSSSSSDNNNNNKNARQQDSLSASWILLPLLSLQQSVFQFLYRGCGLCDASPPPPTCFSPLSALRLHTLSFNHLSARTKAGVQRVRPPMAPARAVPRTATEGYVCLSAVLQEAPVPVRVQASTFSTPPQDTKSHGTAHLALRTVRGPRPV